MTSFLVLFLNLLDVIFSNIGLDFFLGYGLHSISLTFMWNITLKKNTHKKLENNEHKFLK